MTSQLISAFHINLSLSSLIKLSNRTNLLLIRKGLMLFIEFIVFDFVLNLFHQSISLLGLISHHRVNYHWFFSLLGDLDDPFLLIRVFRSIKNLSGLRHILKADSILAVKVNRLSQITTIVLRNNLDLVILIIFGRPFGVVRYSEDPLIRFVVVREMTSLAEWVIWLRISLRLSIQDLLKLSLKISW